jgi:hypothetical protein
MKLTVAVLLLSAISHLAQGQQALPPWRENRGQATVERANIAQNAVQASADRISTIDLGKGKGKGGYSEYYYASGKGKGKGKGGYDVYYEASGKGKGKGGYDVYYEASGKGKGKGGYDEYYYASGKGKGRGKGKGGSSKYSKSKGE